MPFVVLGVRVKRQPGGRTPAVGHKRAREDMLPKPPDLSPRAARKQARMVWEVIYGPIPSGYVVHHIDEDWSNNLPLNLVALPARAHAHRHHPPNPIPRHKQEDRVAYMLHYAQINRKRTAICVECGASFWADKYEKGLVCSPLCRTRRSWKVRHHVA